MQSDKSILDEDHTDYDYTSGENEPEPFVLEPIFPEKVDSTMHTTLDCCPQKFFDEFILGLSPKRKSIDLHAGGCFAHGMQVVREGVWGRQWDIKYALLQAYDSMMDYWGDYEHDPDLNKSFINTYCALYDYFEHYDIYTDPIQPYRFASSGAPAVEFSFAMPMDVLHPVTGAPLQFCGRLDLLGHYQDMLCMVDEKTTKSLGASWVYQWQMRGQFMGYCRAGQQYGLPVKTAIVRGIGMLKREFKYAQAIIQFEDWQIERWWNAVNYKFRQAVDMYSIYLELLELAPERANSIWVHSYGDACSSYGGCHFTDLCVSHPRHFSQWASDYAIRRWDPLKKNPIAISEIANLPTFDEGSIVT